MEAFKFCMGIQSSSPTSDQFSDCFFSASDPFESALSSIVSSPAAAVNPGSDGVMLRELIGRLGNICSSADNSRYATPLSSPPKLPPPILSPFSGDPGFAERAAKNSLFGINPPVKAGGAEKELGDSREGSSVSDQIPAESNGKKRKAAPRGKPSKESAPSPKNAAIAGAAENEESSGNKRSKKEGVSTSTSCGSNGGGKAKESSNNAEPPKDYIHVRARRGQATDSHSLAERVRREKISERMKFLQDLVPGCNKVTGKAVMLDEIINYVQSLQRQVEFLSMKLSTVNPRMDFNMEALLSKEIFQSRGTLPHGIYPLDSSPLQSLPFGYQHQNLQQFSQLHNNNNTINDHTQFQLNHPQAMLHRNPAIHLAAMDGFAESAQQISTFFEEDLQSVVQMGFGQIQQQPFQGSLASAQMKIEL